MPVKKPYTQQILVVQFSSICLVSIIKRAEGHMLFLHKIFPTFINLYWFETIVEMKKSTLLL